jgi:hypothetical protein
MIEGMYGVEQRHPQKRIRLDDNRPSQVRANAPAPSKSSLLGGYMKEQSDAPLPTTPPGLTKSVDTIDLTEGNMGSLRFLIVSQYCG